MSLLATLESGVEGAGQAIDAGFDVAADFAGKVGFDSAASFLTSFGDNVASATGGAVDEVELGETRDPKKLIRGEPPAVSATAETLAGFADNLESTNDAFGKISAGDWTGDAAVEFDTEFRKQRQLWADAADAMTAASAQLTAWNSALEVAQAKAAHAVEVWNSAEGSRSAYNALDAERRVGVTDTWTGQYAEARSILREARTMRDQAADRLADALDAATAKAPEEPSLVQQWLNNLNDLGAAVDFGVERGKAQAIASASELVGLARMVNPTDSYNATHPAEYLQNLSGLAADAAHTVTHPVETLQAMTSEARSNPFGFVSGLGFDAALGAATGGAGFGLKGFDGPDGDHGETVEADAEPTPVGIREVQTFEATEFRNAKLSEKHFNDHGLDFASSSEAEYVAAAKQFLLDAQVNDYPAKIDWGGRVRIYDSDTNTFAAYSSDGTIVTIFKPKESDAYWDDQIGEPMAWAK